MGIRVLVLSLLLLMVSLSGIGQEAIHYEGKRMLIGDRMEILEDRSSSMTLEDVMHSQEFVPSTDLVPNLGISPNAYWVRFKVQNPSRRSNLNVQIAYTLIDSISFYQVSGDSVLYQNHSGGRLPFNSRQVDQHQTYIYSVQVADEDISTFYFRVRSGAQLMLPVYVSTRYHLLEGLLEMDMLFGIYAGIILVMILYNTFVYFSLRDKHYLLYIIYLLTVVFTQASLEGYTFRFLLPNHPMLATYSIYIFSALIGFTAIEFAKGFLNSKRYTPRMHRLSYLFYVAYGLAILLPFLGQFNLSYQLILMCAALSGIYVFVMALMSLLQGSRPARYFLIAWSVFILSVVVYVMKDFGWLPYSFFTYSALRIGSAFEAVMLSFALADKINMYREEKEAYQEKAYRVVKENERIVREQNVILEEQVSLRTAELQKANKDLENTLEDLQETQAQLIESEKMASLGQLTAGIAHEINNPINFVTSNVSPLRRDIAILHQLLMDIEVLNSQEISKEERLQKIKTLKEEADFDYLNTEIDFLLDGISEGASRTSDIVKGLRLFSRLDEDDVKLANIEEGLDSTIAIINHLLNGKISVERKYEGLPPIECFPGKLNQVFLNMMTNAIQAIQERWGDENKGVLTISTSLDGENAKIIIEDNGIGMSEETKKKLFEPFFTTKDVGVGTGLGLSIGWNTIKKHNGTIQVNSEVGKGTAFVLTIPIIHNPN